MFVSHDPAAVESMCDRAVLLVDGRVVDDGPTADVLATLPPPAREPGLSAPRRGGATRCGTTDARVWGNREVVIHACRLLGRRRGPGTASSAGERLTIEMEIEVRAPCSSPIFGISVHSVQGALCYGTNTRLDALHDPSIERRQPSSVSRCSRLPLNEGRFTVQMAVLSNDESDVYDWLERWLEFSVFASSASVGLVDLAAELEFQPSRAPASASRARPPSRA